VPASTPTLTPTDEPQRASALVDRLGRRAGLDGVLADLRRVAVPLDDEPDPAAVALGWEQSDGDDPVWWPQGLSTDAEAGGRPASVLLAAWYAKGWRGWHPNVAARVSVLSLAERRYEHVLLVEPARVPGVGSWPVPVHAGGLAWCGDVLLVADTRHGVRVFDLRDITELVKPARGCRFALPQRGRWTSSTPRGAAAVTFSFLSLDPAGGPWLLAGEYQRPGDGTRLLRYPLEPLLAGRTAAAVEVLPAGLASMQGVARVDGTYWVSASRGATRRGRLWYRHGDDFESLDDALPIGCEDLSYDSATGRLWTQGEYPGRRRVVGLPLPSRD
jgi:hypothetical protein